MFHIVDIALSTISIHYILYIKSEYFPLFYFCKARHHNIHNEKNHLAINSFIKIKANVVFLHVFITFGTHF